MFVTLIDWSIQIAFISIVVLDVCKAKIRAIEINWLQCASESHLYDYGMLVVG